MTTFTPFLRLPLEIQILILRFYLPSWEFSITVSQSPIIPANFRIGTGCPFNFIFRAAGPRKDLCTIWTSRDLHEPARKALEQSFDGQVNLQTPGFWHYPQRKPMFCAFVLPGLPAQMIKKIVLGVDHQLGTTPKAPRSYMSWRELVNFVDLQKMPNLEALQINMLLLGSFDFGIEQIGDLLRGVHDETVLECFRRKLPPVRAHEPREMQARNGRAITLQVHTVDVLHTWVPKWKTEILDSQTDIVSDARSFLQRLHQYQKLIRLRFSALLARREEHRRFRGEEKSCLFGA